MTRGSFRSEEAVPPAVSQLQMSGARFLTASPGQGLLVAAGPQPGRTELHRLTVRSEAVEEDDSVTSWETDR